MDTEAPCTSTLLPKILCLFAPAWLSRLPENLLPCALPFPQLLGSPWNGEGPSVLWRVGLPHLPSQRSRLQGRPHGYTRERQTDSLADPNPEHPRPSGCTEGAVVLLESPMFRRRNLDSEQDAPKVKISRGKWKLASDLAGLFRSQFCKSASFKCLWLAKAGGKCPAQADILLTDSLAAPHRRTLPGCPPFLWKPRKAL